MALKVERRGLVTSDNLVSKPLLCHTCKERKPGLFTTDGNNKPQCPDCREAEEQRQSRGR